MKRSCSCFTALALVLSGSAANAAEVPQQGTPTRTRILIDADIANEVDDLYAIVRALIEPSFDVVGLCSAQWQISHYATPNTLEDSQRLNEVLLALLNQNRIPHPRGAAMRLYDWGQDVAQHSAAAYHVIKEAHRTPPGQKLVVLMLGASTDLASALLIDPTIVPKLKVYLLGTTYDFDKRIWRKRDFNCVMDPQAIEVVLDAKDLETHIMPVNVAARMEFDMTEVKQKFAGRNDLLDLLYRRWVDHMDGSRVRRIIWDLSVVSCLLRPQFGEEITVETPPENTPREVFIYSRIDGRRIREEFFNAVAAHYRLDLSQPTPGAVEPAPATAG
jgi:inosine-uridine nucleoside N-ribohydrolase